MRRRHFETLRPLCPVCLRNGDEEALVIAAAVREEGDVIVEGLLQCPASRCLREYPVVDAVPLLIADLRAWMSANLLHVMVREDLSPELESLIGDACGPGSAFDSTRLYLSSYARDHYGELDRGDADPGSSVVGLLARALELAGKIPDGPVIDVGCAVGRTSFELARRYGGLVLGVDLNFSMLRLASRLLHRGEVRYDRRRVGVVYDRRRFEARFAGSERVDFWACDATALPFAAGGFAAVSSLNLLDCVVSPRDALAETARLLHEGGIGWLSTPYDWSPAATPIEAWIGGHSQRGPQGGAAEPLLRSLLCAASHPAAIPGLRLVAEDLAVPWRVPMHERGTMEYRVHLCVVEKGPSGSPG